MKKIIIVLCSMLLVFSSASVVFADNVEDYDKGIELISASASENSVSCSGTAGDADNIVVAIAIQVIQKNEDGSIDIKAMKTVEVENNKFNATLDADLVLGNKYIVRIANFDAGENGTPWHVLEVIARESGKTDDGDKTVTKYVIPKTGIK